MDSLPFKPLPTDLFGGTISEIDSSLPLSEQVSTLQSQLALERKRVQYLLSERQELRQKFVDLNADLEKEEELITNKLLSQIRRLQEEQEELTSDVENSSVVNSYRSAINQLRKEKIALENALEREQEALILKLTRRIQRLSRSDSLTSSGSFSDG
ncbi:hypothetical protein RCL1_000010 [Eukaryota sp. TZLM3-RCL]